MTTVAADTRALFARLRAEVHSTLRAKIDGSQGGVPTFFDSVLLSAIARLERGAATEDSPGSGSEYGHRLLASYARLRAAPRLVSYAARAAESKAWIPLPWECREWQFNATQGVTECLRWRGLPLFKSVFDFAVYPMLLADVRPASVIELGSGTGASALWFADILQAHGSGAHVYSIDLTPPAIDASAVTFITGDCRNLESVFESHGLLALPHPWVVIEDVHVDTGHILGYLARILRRGDYLIVEDSHRKTDALADLNRTFGAHFQVDTRYTDFFGRNSTCSADSILVAT
jgi:cephalosporin hydroxylase